jgi:hypothetical protein
MTDRGFWMIGLGVAGNVRRLMYQTLICPFAGAGILGHQPRRLRPKFSQFSADLAPFSS